MVASFDLVPDLLSESYLEITANQNKLILSHFDFKSFHIY